MRAIGPETSAQFASAPEETYHAQRMQPRCHIAASRPTLDRPGAGHVGYHGRELVRTAPVPVHRKEPHGVDLPPRSRSRENPLSAARQRAALRSPVGSVDFGDLRRTEPVSRVFGLDRGTPIDRYYIERFLAENAAPIRGRVLEIGDRDVHHAIRRRRSRPERRAARHRGVARGHDHRRPRATAPQIPDDTFDCIILTQTLQFTYAMERDVAELHRILTPGGMRAVHRRRNQPDQPLRHGPLGRLLASDLALGPRAVRDARFAAAGRRGHDVRQRARRHRLPARARVEELDPERTRRARRRLPAHRLGQEPRRPHSDVRLRSTVRDFAFRHVGGTAIVLAYHRVASLERDPQPSVSIARQLRTQSRVLAETAIRTIGLAELLHHLSRRTVPNRVIAVTFDDGYADALLAAAPMLEPTRSRHGLREQRLRRQRPRVLVGRGRADHALAPGTLPREH